MDDRTRLNNYLKKYHKGEEHTICGKQLELVLGIQQSAIKRHVHHLRMSGVPICSSNAGYFYAETRQEITETIGRFNRHITAMMKTESRLLETRPDEKEKIVFVIPDEGLKVSMNIKSIKKG